MRTRLIEVVLLGSLLATPIVLAETAAPAAPNAAEPRTEAPAAENKEPPATADKLAMQSEARTDKTLRDIKIYPCF